MIDVTWQIQCLNQIGVAEYDYARKHAYLYIEMHILLMLYRVYILK